MKLKRMLSLLSSLAIAVTILISTMPVSAETITGKCGDNATWSFNSSTGVLTISGTGDMYTYYKPVNTWEYYPYRNEIKEVVVEEGITYISKCVFGKSSNFMYEKSSEYPNLTKLTLPSTVKVIDSSAFYRSGLKTIKFSEGIETIEMAAFACTPLSGDLVLPQTLDDIGEHAFEDTNIISVNLHEGMRIHGCAFYGCNSIKEVTIPKDLWFLCTQASNAMRDNCAFAQCESLEKVIIKGESTLAGMTQSNTTIKNAIADGLFSRCTSLKDIIIETEDIEYVKKPESNRYEQTSGTFWFENNPTFYIYKNSTTEKTLREAGYLKDATDENEANYVYLAETETLEEAITKAEEMDTSGYTEESVDDLAEALETGKAILEKAKENIVEANQEEIDEAVKAINEAIEALEEKPTEPTSAEPSTDPSDSSSEPSSDNSTDLTSPTNTEPTTSPTNTPNVTTKPSNNSVAQAKANAEKIMNQAKITKLKVKSKSKKKITVSWKKVNKAVGYEVQVAKNNKFKMKKIVLDKFTKNKKITIKKKIKSGKTYYVRVRAYATYKDENGKARKVYSKWIRKVRKVTVK